MSNDSQKLVQAIGLCEDLLSDTYPCGSFNACHKDQRRHRAAEEGARSGEKLSPIHLAHGEIAENQRRGSLSHQSEGGDGS